MDRFNVAVDVVQNAGDLLRQCRLEESEICQKTGHQDLVTHWDRKIEQLLRNEILTAFPQDSIVGEEYPPEAHRTGAVTWYIDPIDGTTNFINQHQNYAISVGCWEGSTPLLGLVLDVERETLETALVDALRQAFRHLCAPETYLDDYRQLCLNLGRQVHILQTDETVTALDIDPQYGLVVRHGSGAVETLRCGEVSVRGLYGYAE